MNTKAEKPSLLFKIIKKILYIFYPEFPAIGMENLPDEPCVIVANHSQMHGPIACELHFNEKKYIWCAGQMMSFKDVPAYAYADFWSQKSKLSRPFYKILSYLIAPLAVVIFNNAHTIAVNHDTRIITTFKETLARLEAGNYVIIFPEYDEPDNDILYKFRDKFIDVARLYYKRTGKKLKFVPMYIAPKLKQMHLGNAIEFNPENDLNNERSKICKYLSDTIVKIAKTLPIHTVIPYRNIPKRYYKTNRSQEDVPHEEACG